MASLASIDRGLDLLETLSGEADGLSLGVLAERLDLPKSATHRLLTALVARRFAVQDPLTQRYRLSIRLALLAFRHLDATGLPDLAQPILDRLAAETGEHVRLAVLEGERLIWIARAQGASRGLRYDPEMGQEVVLHATATGKAWLATLPEETALRLVIARGFETPPHFGRRAVKTVSALRQHLAETRRRGYGLAVEEGEPDTAAIAAVVRGSDALVVGTVSVAAPLTRFTGERRERAVHSLLAAVGEMSALWPVRRRHSAARSAVAPESDAGRVVVLAAAAGARPPRLKRKGAMP
ncbi:MAG: IclR family transcriptional regulator [Pseudomonadota bacterium]